MPPDNILEVIAANNLY